MPRTARASAGGYCYHVLNRGNGRATVFHKLQDYEAFLDLVSEATVRISIRLLAYCPIPNHFHLVLWPHVAGDLSRWMHWLMTTHMRCLPLANPNHRHRETLMVADESSSRPDFGRFAMPGGSGTRPASQSPR
jgi:REP element-mobilizing transposase RayT